VKALDQHQQHSLFGIRGHTPRVPRPLVRRFCRRN